MVGSISYYQIIINIKESNNLMKTCKIKNLKGDMEDKILVIGCGGLGSELLKLLVSRKFKKLIVVDNDNIDLTNLNRQFLFTKKDINKSKGITAVNKLSKKSKVKSKGKGKGKGIVNKLSKGITEVKSKGIVNKLSKGIVNKLSKGITEVKSKGIVNKLSKGIVNKLSKGIVNKLSKEIIGIHADIKTFKDINWYKQFDIVYNCLDNNEARLFVNQRCVAAGIKMIDGGSEGWLGQSFNNGLECFDCLPKKNKDIYPVCNIRQEAKTFEHCLVWGNVVYKENSVMEVKRELQMYWEMKNSNNDNTVYSNDNTVCSNDNTVCNNDSNDNTVCNNDSNDNTVCNNDNTVCNNDSNDNTVSNNDSNDNTVCNTVCSNDNTVCNNDSNDNTVCSNDNTVCNTVCNKLIRKRENYKLKRQFLTKEFIEIMKIKRNIIKLKEIKNKIRIIDFDTLVKEAFIKNNEMSIYKLACLKAEIFKIKPYSFLRSETFLKNIVPSICTTNAIIASLMILSARNNKNYYLVQNNSIFIPVDLNDKRKDCLTCRNPRFICEFNYKGTIRELLEEFSATELIFANNFYNLKSNQRLEDLLLDNEFGIIKARDKKYNFYFKKSDMNENIKIIIL